MKQLIIPSPVYYRPGCDVDVSVQPLLSHLRQNSVTVRQMIFSTGGATLRDLEPMFDTPDLLQIFPSFVWRACLKPDLSKSINTSLLDSIRDIGAPFAHI